MENQKLLEKLRDFTAITDKAAEIMNKLVGEKTYNNRWLTGADVKLLLSISESTLKRLRKRKDIPFTKIGKTCYYPSAFFEHILLKRAKFDAHDLKEDLLHR